MLVCPVPSHPSSAPFPVFSVVGNSGEWFFQEAIFGGVWLTCSQWWVCAPGSWCRYF